MKSKWKVTTNYINGRNMYAVYRLIDIAEIDHSGNREFASGYMDDKQVALALAEQKNSQPAGTDCEL